MGVDVVEWSRALDVRLSEWCCSVSMVWVQISTTSTPFIYIKEISKKRTKHISFDFLIYIYS